MEKLRKNLPIILGSVACTLLLVIVIILISNNGKFTFNNKTNSSSKDTNTTKEVENTKKEENNVEENNSEGLTIEIKDDVKETTKEENTNTNTTTTNNNSTTTTNNTVVEDKKVETVVPQTEAKVTEEELVNYFKAEENSIDGKKNDATIREKVKTTFVSIVDFIFYGKEIKGHTFKELTTSAKLKIISIALKIDNKIDSYFPDYKDKIKDKYNDIKTKLSEKYVELTEKLCDKMGETACNQFKEDYAVMKEKFGLAVDFLKEKAGVVKEKAASILEKIKGAYEDWRYE